MADYLEKQSVAWMVASLVDQLDAWKATELVVWQAVELVGWLVVVMVDYLVVYLVFQTVVTLVDWKVALLVDLMAELAVAEWDEMTVHFLVGPWDRCLVSQQVEMTAMQSAEQKDLNLADQKVEGKEQKKELLTVAWWVFQQVDQSDV